MEYNPSQQDHAYSAFPGYYNPERSTGPSQATFQAVGHTQDGWMQQQLVTDPGPSTYTPNSWEAQQELESIITNQVAGNYWAPPPTIVNVNDFSARVSKPTPHPAYLRPHPFQDPTIFHSTTTARRWNHPYLNTSSHERIHRPKIVVRTSRRPPNAAPRLQYPPADRPASHTTSGTNAYPQNNILETYPSPRYTAMTAEPSSFPHMTASPQQIPIVSSRAMVQTDSINPAPVPSTSGTNIPPSHPVHAVVPHDDNETTPSEPILLQSQAPSRASTSAVSPTSSTPKQVTCTLSLDKQIDDFFPLGTPDVDVDVYRSKLRSVLTSSWMQENRMEPQPELLLEFMEKVGKKWFCRFYVNGDRCQASSSEREVQALEHVRRHIGLKPFVCDGPWYVLVFYCRYACSPPSLFCCPFDTSGLMIRLSLFFFLVQETPRDVRSGMHRRIH
ncbi:hypothetical protein FRC16_001218 [Serendipita sp. 398]|nr:hypothetical protein FRC16_001218 [Serendipita sp. 398]